MITKNRVYSLETKMQATRLREEGVSVKEIQKILNIKSESQVYTWWHWHRDNELFRLEQRPGKQYSFATDQKEQHLRSLLERRMKYFKSK